MPKKILQGTVISNKQDNTITVLGKEYLYGGIIENFDSIIKPWNKKKEDMTERELFFYSSIID